MSLLIFLSFEYHSENHKASWVFPDPSFPEIITCLLLSRENLIALMASKMALFLKQFGKFFGMVNSPDCKFWNEE